MSVLEILTIPDPLLRIPSQPVSGVDEQVRRLIDDMFQTMYSCGNGVGLAAPQVGVSKRVIVMDVPDKNGKPRPLAMINPELLELSEEKITYQEGCLSVPGQFAELHKRAQQVKVSWLDRDGKKQEMQAEGLLAICIQHEIDHINGVLFIDHLSALRRSMLLRKLEKERRKG